MSFSLNVEGDYIELLIRKKMKKTALFFFA